MIDEKTKENIDSIKQAVDVIAKLTITQSPLDGYLETAKDRFLQSNFGLWNTLISLNGIIATIFSAFVAVSNGSKIINTIIFIILIFNFFSIILMILCYTTSRSMYKEMFAFSNENKNKFPEEYIDKFKELNNKSLRKNRLIASYEKISFYCTSGAACLIIAILFIA